MFLLMIVLIILWFDNNAPVRKNKDEVRNEYSKIGMEIVNSADSWSKSAKETNIAHEHTIRNW